MDLVKAIVVPDAGKKTYDAVITCTPGAVAANSVLYSLLNPATNPNNIELVRAMLNLFFFGTATASAVAIGVRRYSHATGYTGGSLLTAVKMNSNDPAAAAIVRNATTGVLTDPGVVVGADFHSLGSPNQLIATASNDFNIPDSPLILAPGEGIAVYAITAILASTTIDGCFRWRE